MCSVMIRAKAWETDPSCTARDLYLCHAAALERLGDPCISTLCASLIFTSALHCDAACTERHRPRRQIVCVCCVSHGFALATMVYHRNVSVWAPCNISTRSPALNTSCHTVQRSLDHHCCCVCSRQETGQRRSASSTWRHFASLPSQRSSLRLLSSTSRSDLRTRTRARTCTNIHKYTRAHAHAHTHTHAHTHARTQFQTYASRANITTAPLLPLRLPPPIRCVWHTGRSKE